MQFLVILKVKPDTQPSSLGPLLKAEAAKVWELYSGGALRSVQYIQGPIGAVLMFEATDAQQVTGYVQQLPMVEHNLLSVEILPLTPFLGYAALFAAPLA